MLSIRVGRLGRSHPSQHGRRHTTRRVGITLQPLGQSDHSWVAFNQFGVLFLLGDVGVAASVLEQAFYSLSIRVGREFECRQ